MNKKSSLLWGGALLWSTLSFAGGDTQEVAGDDLEGLRQSVATLELENDNVTPVPGPGDGRLTKEDADAVADLFSVSVGLVSDAVDTFDGEEEDLTDKPAYGPGNGKLDIGDFPVAGKILSTTVGVATDALSNVDDVLEEAYETLSDALYFLFGGDDEDEDKNDTVEQNSETKEPSIEKKEDTPETASNKI